MPLQGAHLCEHACVSGIFETANTKARVAKFGGCDVHRIIIWHTTPDANSFTSGEAINTATAGKFASTAREHAPAKVNFTPAE